MFLTENKHVLYWLGTLNIQQKIIKANRSTCFFPPGNRTGHKENL